MPQVKMTVNGKPASGEVEGRTLLVEFLRENLGLTGTCLLYTSPSPRD